MLETKTEFHNRTGDGPVSCIPAWVAYNANGQTIGRTSYREHWAPKYCTDLNAIHEAEKALVNQFTLLEEAYWRSLEYVKPHPIYATARQRAEALVAVIEASKASADSQS